MKTTKYFASKLGKTQEHARLTARNAFTFINGSLVSIKDARNYDYK